MDSNKWICHICGKELSRKQTLKTHLSCIHGESVSPAKKKYKVYESNPCVEIPTTTKYRWKNQLNTSDSSSVPTSLPITGTLHEINNHHDQAGSNQQLEQETVDIEQPIQNSSPTIGDAESSTLLSRFIPVVGISQDRDRIVSLDCASEEINELYTGHLKPPSEVVDDFGLVNTMDICESDMENDSSGQSIESESMDSDSDHEDNINSESQTFQSPPLFVLTPSSEVYKSDITHYEHMLAVNALATSGNLSSLVIQNLLDLIKLHVPDKSLCEGNVNDLKKKLGFNKDYLQNFEYCSICGSTFPDDGNVLKTCRTPGCGGLRSNRDYFVVDSYKYKESSSSSCNSAERTCCFHGSTRAEIYFQISKFCGKRLNRIGEIQGISDENM